MTCREKLKLEQPEAVDVMYAGGCASCPNEYGYLRDPDWCHNPDKCRECWDREIPEERLTTQHIVNSGSTTEFATGAHRDAREGKGRCDLLPLEVVTELMQDEIIGYIANFMESGDTAELYTCLDSFAYPGRVFKCAADMLLEVSKHYEDGGKKYGDDNWKKGMSVRCYIDSALRHYLKWLRGDEDERHDRAFVWNLMCCIWEVDHHVYDEEDN